MNVFRHVFGGKYIFKYKLFKGSGAELLGEEVLPLDLFLR